MVVASVAVNIGFEDELQGSLLSALLMTMGAVGFVIVVSDDMVTFFIRLRDWCEGRGTAVIVTSFYRLSSV